MSVTRKMKNIFSFLLVSTVTDAILYSNQSNNPTKSFEIADFPEDDGYSISHRQDLFIDCSSYSSWLLSSATAIEASTTEELATLASVNPATSSPIVPFEQYWCENFDETTPVGESIGPWLYGINASEKEYCFSLEKSNYSSWAAVHAISTSTVGWNETHLKPPPLWAPTLTQPCCGTLCNIVASAVQLYFWPTPAPFPNITTVVGSDGFIYTSPSVYIVYKHLHATSQCGILGPSYSSITLSYHQTDLSTDLGLLEGASPTAVNYADIFTNCTDPMTVSEISDRSNHCSPFLQMPAGLQSLNPAWSACLDTMVADDIGYVVDPPRALVPATALGPAPTKAASTTATAAPVSPATRPLPLKTAHPGGSNVIGGPSNDPSNGNHPPAANKAAGANGSLRGNDAQAGHDQLVGSDPQTGKDLAYPKSANNDPSKDFSLVNQQLHQSPAGKISINNDPAEARTPFMTTIDGHVLQAGSSANGIVIDGQSVTRGGVSITVSGTLIALHSNGNLMLGTSTVQNVLSSMAPISATVFTVGSQPITLSSNSLIAADTTLGIDNPGFTMDGTIVSLGDSALQIGTSTIQLSYDTPVLPTSVITAAGQPVTILPNGAAIAGVTLTANAPAVTLAGTPMYFGADSLVLGTSTIPLPSIPPTSTITIAGQTYAISQLANGVSVAGRTLRIGQPAITVLGTPVALDRSGLVIDGTSTVPYQSIVGVSSLSNSVGGVVLAGLNGVSAPTTAGPRASNQTTKNTTGPAGGSEVFQGGGGKVQVPSYCPVALTIIMLLTWLLRTGF